VSRRRQQDKATSSNDDYGFYNPVGIVEKLYWERENARRRTFPDPGGMLDQDEHMMDDLSTYGWLVSFAENILDQEAEVLNKAKGQRR
jgi:hypothetical protein